LDSLLSRFAFPDVGARFDAFTETQNYRKWLLYRLEIASEGPAATTFSGVLRK
jgi:hypothetical protein